MRSVTERDIEKEKKVAGNGRNANTNGNGNGHSAGEQEVVEEAAREVVEATDVFAPDGGIEMAMQAEMVGDGVVAAADAELTKEERRSVSKNVFRLAWPAIAENALQTLLGIVDTAVVARLGVEALSGVGAAQQLIWILTTALVAISMGTTVLVARHIGAKQKSEANSVLKQSLLLALVSSAVLMPVGFLAHPMMTLLGLESNAASEGAIFLGITVFSALPLVIMFIAGAAMRGAGDTRTPMLVTMGINAINAVLAVELVFGGVKANGILGGWLPWLNFIPEMGVAGSAWASVIARSIGALALVGMFFVPKAALSLRRGGGGSWLPNFDIVGRVMKIGVPSALEQLFMSLGILLYSLIVIGLGEVTFAASRLALNAVFLSQLPGFGFAIAATTLVGQSLGAKSPKRALLGAQLAVRSAVVWMGLMGVVFFFFGEFLMKLFTDDPRLIALGVDSLKVIALYQPMLAIAFVLGGALRGAGDVKFPMWVTTFAVWLVRLPTGAFLGLPAVCVPGTSACVPGLGWGLQGIYAALIVETSIRAILLWWRFKEGKWQTMKV
ncbi:MAG: MATE family efflux transporter [Chloroflexia bacterium]